MQNKTFNYILLLAIIAITGSCKKVLKPQIAKNIYLCGQKKVNQVSQACYWKNGALVMLGNGNTPSQAVAIFEKPNGDVVVAGTTGLEPKTAVYWVNGSITQVTDGQADADVYNMAVQGDSVILCGSVIENAERSAAVWFASKTVIGFTHTYSGANGVFTDIKILNNKIHAVGYETYNNHTVPLYVADAVGGARQLLLDSFQNAMAKSIDIVDGKVYIAGEIENTNNGYYAMYWVNGVRNNLTSSFNNLTTQVETIVFADANVYIAGTKYNGTIFQPILFTNNSQAQYTSPNANDNLARGLSIVGSKQYVASTEYSGEVGRAVLWTNGAPTYMPDKDVVVFNLFVSTQDQ